MNSKELHNFEEAMGNVELMLPSITQALFMYYKALINAGFSDEQAIYLVAQHGTSFGYKPIGGV